MTYAPFVRGPHPVGVRTVEIDAGGRRLTTEVWYPTIESYTGADLDRATKDRYTLIAGREVSQAAVRDAVAAPGHRPFAVFSHGYAGHRRQSTFFTTHLASHGWVVASADHPGNTLTDMFSRLGQPPGDDGRDSAISRPDDVRAVIDAAGDGRLGIDVALDRVAVTGHSFGGWTALAVVAREPRVAAVVALTPAIGVPILREALDLRWGRPVPTLVIAAARDSILPIAALEAVARELPSPHQLVVLEEADHLHFCDAPREVHELFRRIPLGFVALTAPLLPFEELAPESHGHDAACGLGLALLDAHIRGDAAARAFVDRDPLAILRERGIAVR